MNKQFGITEPDLGQLWVSPICQGKESSVFASTVSTEGMERATSSNMAKSITHFSVTGS